MRQHALLSDFSLLWRYRLCRTSIPISGEYRLITRKIKAGENFEWLCPDCVVGEVGRDNEEHGQDDSDGEEKETSFNIDESIDDASVNEPKKIPVLE